MGNVSFINAAIKPFLLPFSAKIVIFSEYEVLM
jgi:hypothetical protein